MKSDKKAKQQWIRLVFMRDQLMASFRDQESDLQRIAEGDISEVDYSLIQMMANFCLGEVYLNADMQFKAEK
jgi:hypothetical protein